MNLRSEMNADLPSPFSDFAGPARNRHCARAITAAYRRPEPECVAALIDAARLPERQAAAAHELARGLAQPLRARRVGVGREGLVQGLMQEFSLSSQEGVALMCLAEALLRIPDAATRDALIRDKIGDGDWESHLGQQPVAVRQRRHLGPAAHRQAGRRRTARRAWRSALTRVVAQQRRAADPQGRRHGDAPDGRAVRHRRDDRRGAGERAQAREARGLPLFVRHAGRGGADRADDAQRYLRGLRAGDPRDRRGVRPGAASTKARASRSSCRRCIRATAARSASA